LGACDGETCGGTNNPSIVLKIGDPSGTYAGGSINWAGKTWTQTQINDNNFEQCVCPTNYVGPRKNFNTSFTKTAEHQWDNEQTANNRLLLQRFSASGSFSAQNHITLRVNGIHPSDIFRYYFSAFYSSNFEIGFLNATTPAIPNQTNYQITDDFFGTYVDGGSGLEYTWTKGANW
jgi:hypothetical protein